MHNIMLTWQQSAGLAVALAAVGVGLRLARDPRARAASAFAVEACIIAALYTIWQLVGAFSLMGTAGAIRRADWIARFEHTVRLPSERGVQELILHHPLLVQAANLYYDIMHFGIIFVFLLWLFARHRDRYGAVRTILALTTLACLAIQLIPVAPPRILPGYVDTAAAYGQSVYGGQVADELSAMPSVHVAWAVLVGWYTFRIARSRWRYLGPAHAVVTVFVVVATGNHWWLDGIVAVGVLGACAWAQIGVTRVWVAWTTARTGVSTDESDEADQLSTPVAVQ